MQYWPSFSLPHLRVPYVGKAELKYDTTQADDSEMEGKEWNACLVLQTEQRRRRCLGSFAEQPGENFTDMYKMLAPPIMVLTVSVAAPTLATTDGGELTDAGPLEITGNAEITVDGRTLTYHTVLVESEARTYRSSVYSQYVDEYVISIEAYENPRPAEKLDALVPIAEGPLITVHTYINAEGQETRGAEITWEADPEGRFYWGSDGMRDDVTLRLDSFDLDPKGGYFRGDFSGRVCHTSLPAIRVDRDNCKDVAVRIDSELSEQ